MIRVQSPHAELSRAVLKRDRGFSARAPQERLSSASRILGQRRNQYTSFVPTKPFTNKQGQYLGFNFTTTIGSGQNLPPA
jgi:hypothetical protein